MRFKSTHLSAFARFLLCLRSSNLAYRCDLEAQSLLCCLACYGRSLSPPGSAQGWCLAANWAIGRDSNSSRKCAEMMRLRASCGTYMIVMIVRIWNWIIPYIWLFGSACNFVLNRVKERLTSWVKIIQLLLQHNDWFISQRSPRYRRVTLKFSLTRTDGFSKIFRTYDVN